MTATIATPTTVPVRSVYDLLTHPPQHSAYQALNQRGAHVTTLWGAARNDDGIQHSWANPAWAARAHAMPDLARIIALAAAIVAAVTTYRAGASQSVSVAVLVTTAVVLQLLWAAMPVITRRQREDDIVLAVTLACHPTGGATGLLPNPVLQALGDTAITGIRPDGTLWRPDGIGTQEAIAQLVLAMASTWAKHPTTATERQLLEIALHLPDTVHSATQTRQHLR